MRKCGVMISHIHAIQTEAGYADVRRQLERGSAGARLAPITEVVRIPTVVHILHYSDDQNVTDDVVHRQMEALNRDFRMKNDDIESVPEPFKDLIADTKLEFHLATRDPSGRPTTGIERVRTPIAKFPLQTPPHPNFLTNYIERECKVEGTGAPAWPREQYLNIWVCDMGRNPLGFAAFPGSAAWRDGVVIDTRCFGIGSPALSPFDLGRTLTHEIGHWLDLLHIWGDDGGACDRSDNVSDTPNQGGPSSGMPTFPTVSCNNHPHGNLFVNFMDYTNDAGMVMFTKGQVQRMHAALRRARASLLISDGLDAPTAEAGVSAMSLIRSVAAKVVEPQPAMVFDGVDWVNS